MVCEGIVEVTERLLRNDPTLTSITLKAEWFSFSDDVLEKFARAMESSSIENLELLIPSVPLTKENCEFIARIVRCHCIHSLDLSYKSSIDVSSIVSSIMAAISQNSAIKELVILAYHDGKECAVSLAKFLRSKRSSLNSLGLYGCTIRDIGDEGCIAVTKALRSYSSLKELSMRRCGIGTDGAKAIGQLLGSSAIEELMISETPISDECCAAVMAGLLENSSVRALVMRDCGIGKEGVEAIANVLSSGRCAIEELMISKTPIRDAGCVAVMVGLLENSSVRVLVMRDCGIGKESVEAIANVLSSGKCTIQYLDLRDSIGDEGCSLIMEALRNNNSIYKLYLTNCDIGDEGMKSIANVLQNNHAPCLRCISLFLNRRIGVNGFKALAIALSQNSSLEDLSLSNCCVHDDDGCIHLMNGLSQNSSLKVIHLRHCNIGVEGVKAIANFLKKNAGSIHELNLNGNHFDEESLIEIAKALQFNTHLTKLGFDFGFLGGREKIWSAFDDAAYHNYSLQELCDIKEFDEDDKFKHYKKSIEKHLDVNKKLGPVKAEMVKTGLFPNQILPHLKTASCFVEALSKVASLGHLSPVFDLVCKQPMLFDLDHCVAERLTKNAEWNEP